MDYAEHSKMMEEEEQIARMRNMSKAVEAYTVKDWAEEQMKALEENDKKQNKRNRTKQ